MKNEPALLTGSANPALAAALAENLGLRLTPCQTDRFPDGEIAVQLLAPLRDRTVFLVQPTSPPVNDHLIVSVAPLLAAAVRQLTSDGSISDLDRVERC